MDDKCFVWTSQLYKKMLKLKFENDLLFKTKKQPWREFHDILRENGFPKEMTIDHVRKKWSYTYDMYKLAKKSNNKSWPYYKLFDKHFGHNKTLDKKYESWNDEWRLKLIICITEAKEANLDFLTMWKTVERAMRCQDLPIDCCIQDMKALWHHLRMTFNRKHRMKVKKGNEASDWPLYDAMYTYFEKFDVEYLSSLEREPACVFVRRLKASKYSRNNRSIDDIENESEFQWSKDITETFIQIRLQNDWLFRQKKRAWSELLKMMIQEYGFPKTLTSRELGRKWASTMSDYQKSKATNNTSWVYHTLFELYLGESRLSLNPLVDWQEEWVFNLISSRTDLEHLFRTFKDQNRGWREVEKRLRSIGLPLDHSLLDLPEIWAHLSKTFRWKQKFARKGILTEHWPYFEAMTRYSEIQEKHVIKKQKVEDGLDHFADVTNDDDYEDDLKLFELKQKLGDQVKPKYEVNDADQCRTCSGLTACVDIFEQRDDEGLDAAFKLKVIAGVEVEKSDNLPSQICLICLQELENAYKFRRKCQDVDKRLRNTAHLTIKIEILENHEDHRPHDDAKDEHDDNGADDMVVAFDPETTRDSVVRKEVIAPKSKKERTIVRKKKVRKSRYNYWKVCDVCGKHTTNLVSHLDTHSNDKTYSCDVCDKKFKFKSGLTVHKAVHDPTPRKTCEVCGKTFHILAQYRRHFVYHANERKYGCETCGKRFNTLDILKVHSRMHTDERPFSCEECGKSFRTAGCVSRHKRIVHRNIKNIKRIQ